jgi:hypothetical protein
LKFSSAAVVDIDDVPEFEEEVTLVDVDVEFLLFTIV